MEKVDGSLCEVNKMAAQYVSDIKRTREQQKGDKEEGRCGTEKTGNRTAVAPHGLHLVRSRKEIISIQANVSSEYGDTGWNLQ